MPRASNISICLVGFELHKAHPDLGDDSGFWLRVNAEDAAPFVEAFKDLPDMYHEFRIEQRVRKEIRTSTLMAQIVKIEEGPAETRRDQRSDGGLSRGREAGQEQVSGRRGRLRRHYWRTLRTLALCSSSVRAKRCEPSGLATK